MKQGGAVITKRFTTVNAVRTIQSVLGITPLGITDGLAQPMTEVFDDVARPWTYRAIVPEVLRTTQLPLPTRTAENSLSITPPLAYSRPRGDVNYWVKAMTGQNFEREDALDEPRYNRALWKGLKGATPYPAVRHGRDMTAQRDKLLKQPVSLIR